MRRRRSYIRRPYALALLAIALLTVPLATAAGDAVLDAKRTAAAKLLKDGKPADAQKLYEEIIAQDDSVWSDHYALAKIYDKAGETPKAVAAYRQVVKLLGNSARTAAERAAVTESKKRLETLDRLSEQLGTAMEAFFKALEAVDREAAKSKDDAMLARTFRLRAAILAAEPKPGVTVLEARPTVYNETGVTLEAGKRYAIHARGQWSLGKGRECTPAGRTDVPPNGQGPLGMLLAIVTGSGSIQAVGESAVITAPENAPLRLVINEDSKQWNDNGGSVWVVVERLD